MILPPFNDGFFCGLKGLLTSQAWRNWFKNLVDHVNVYTGVASVTATAPVQSTGGANPVISMPAATNSISGYFSSADHALLPSSDQKAALAGTDGTPSASDKYVTNSDSRNTNSRQANNKVTLVTSSPYTVLTTDEVLVIGAFDCTLQLPTASTYGNRSFDIQTNYGATNYRLIINQSSTLLFSYIGPVHAMISSDGVATWNSFLYEHKSQHMAGGYDQLFPSDIGAVPSFAVPTTPGTFTKVTVTSDGLVSTGATATATDVGALSRDGSNANSTINVNSQNIATTGDVTCNRNHTSGFDRGNGTDRVLVYGGTTMADGAGMEFYSTGIGFNKGNINFISQSGGGAGTGNILFLNTPDGSSFPTIMKIDSTGRVGIGGATPSAMVDIQAGTAVAGTAPVKFHAGTLLSSLELGTLEFVDNGTTGHLYITLNVAGILTRLQII